MYYLSLLFLIEETPLQFQPLKADFIKCVYQGFQSTGCTKKNLTLGKYNVGASTIKIDIFAINNFVC